MARGEKRIATFLGTVSICSEISELLAPAGSQSFFDVARVHFIYRSLFMSYMIRLSNTFSGVPQEEYGRSP